MLYKLSHWCLKYLVFLTVYFTLKRPRFFMSWEEIFLFYFEDLHWYSQGCSFPILILWQKVSKSVKKRYKHFFDRKAISFPKFLLSLCLELWFFINDLSSWMGSRPVQLLLTSFQYSFDSKQMFYIKVWRWLVLNHGPLVSEATSPPTEPQLLTALPIKLCTP